jgi:DNA-binding MarR family transcriptional regulator
MEYRIAERKEGSPAMHGLDESSSRMWKLFLSAYVTVTEQIERDLEAAGLPPLAWYSVLWALERSPNQELRLHELAKEVLLSRSNITRLIDRLEEANLLCRRRCPKDRRGAYAVLTKDGLAMRQKMWEVYSQGIAQYFVNHLSAHEVNTFTQVFSRLLDVSKAV